MVKEYRLRNTYGDASEQAEEMIKGILTWKMQVIIHQVSLRSSTTSRVQGPHLCSWRNHSKYRLAAGGQVAH